MACSISERKNTICRAAIGILFFLLLCPFGFSQDPSLADAVENKQTKRIDKLFDDKVDVNDAQVDGMTALHWAVFYDDAPLVKKLLRRTADADLKNRYGITALHIACQNGNAEIVQALLEAGADVNLGQKGGETPLMTASRTGKPELVKLLLKHGAIIDSEERRKQTALMWAAAEGHFAVVQELLNSGADLKHELKSGFSALHFAVRNGHTKAVRALIAAGADVDSYMNPANTGGRNPRRGMTPLHLAIENGHYELGRVLLELGADPNDQRCGFTPLHNISWVRKPPRGDNVDGAPPPIGSGTMTSLQFVRVLHEFGAEVDLQLKKGKSGRGRMNHKSATPFLFAARRDDVPLMKLLLELGADPTITNADDCNALMVAAGIGTHAPGEEAGTEEEALEAVALLLELGLDVNHVDKNGETAMHGAAYKSLPRMINFLAVSGAKAEVWNKKNKYGWTPTLIAEGHRVGNFKPAPATLNAVYRQLRAAGIEPPPLTPREKRKGYDQP